MIKTLNNQIACEPFKNNSATGVQISRGVIGVMQKMALTPLVVVFACHDQPAILPGYTVFVPGDACKDLWAKPVDLDGKQVIMVPLTSVYAFASKEDEEVLPVPMEDREFCSTTATPLEYVGS